MPRLLKVLLVEDNPEDAELVVRELTRAGFKPDWVRVDSEAAFLQRLGQDIDLVLSDYRMPGFGGLRALELLKESGLKIPFILISGTIGEEGAVLAMKSGVTDYLLKDRLARLGPAVTHALQEGQARRERLQAEQTLASERSLLRTLIDLLPDAIYVKDREARFVVANVACARHLGVRDPSELIGRKETDFLVGGSLADFQTAEERVLQGEALIDREQEFTRSDGAKRIVLSTKVPLRDRAGVVTGLVGLTRDVTESKRQHEQFLRAQRMEAVGTLAGGIAHDLNNILAPIVMGSGLLLDRLTNPRDRELLEMIQNSGTRGSNVVRQLLTFSRGIGGERNLVQVHHLLREMVGIMRETFPRDITIKEESVRGLRPVVGDPTQLHQVIMNLCVNARDAMPRGGTLTLGAKNAELSAEEVQAHPPAKPGAYLALSVTDTGQGIPPQIIESIFDPFFTTKSLAKGTGLGLSTVLGIVRSHGGFITVTSVLEKGSTFTIYLPLAPHAGAEPAATGTSERFRGTGELILVVDDEPLVLTTTRLILEKNGYRVLTAVNGAQALSVFRQNLAELRLVLTDVMMPVMGGLHLARALRDAKPELRIVATSGLIDQANHNELLRAHVDGIVAKPSNAEEILRVVYEQLTRPG
jgi:two-component system, cell cycle sensor histidine kinase and response regulator CckA